MYWPTSAARVLAVPQPLGRDPVLKIATSRRGNLFATLTSTCVGVWDVRPTVLQAAVERSASSVARWGANADVWWAADGRGLIILTTTSHLVLYQLVPTSLPAYDSANTAASTSAAFGAGAGPGEGDVLLGWELKAQGVAFAMGGCRSVLPQQHNLLLALQHPPAVLAVPYPLPPQLVTPPGSQFPPLPLDGDTEEQVECELWDLTRGREWIDQKDRVPVPVSLSATRVTGIPITYSMIMDDGRVYIMYASHQIEMMQSEGGASSSSAVDKWRGQLVYPSAAETVAAGIDALSISSPTATATPTTSALASSKAVDVAVNGRLGLVAVGTESGIVNVFVLPPYPQPPRFSRALDLKHSANLRVKPGAVTSMAWTSDGYALAVGYEKGWAVWSMSGRLNGWGVASQDDDSEDELASDAFMGGVASLFWAPGNLDLFLLAPGENTRFYAMPLVKSATTGQLSPDNTRYAFLQMDDRVLVYRGADQPDMSVINPESDVWQHIHIPNVYIASNWPIRYASISSDGRFIAVAGRRGLTHYSAASGRWKLFAQEREERGFSVRGGLLWFHHVLIAAVEVDRKYQIRLYSRDMDLSDTNVLHSQSVPSPVLVMTLLDNSLLVYTADSMLYHFVILPTRDSIRIQLCGSMSFRGLVTVPARVRALSWMIPEAQKRLGDPADDLIVATIIFLVDGRMVLLRPRRAGTDEVRYDMQVLADGIETYWTHLHGVGTLENSLWGYDGRSMRVWLDALTIEATRVDLDKDTYESVKESINLRLDFYPLSILMDKGIIIGVDYETSTRSLPFALFKIQTSTNLFLPQFLRYHLDAARLQIAMALSANYQNLVYFGHALEVLLHSVLEDAVDATMASKGEPTSPTSTSLDSPPPQPQTVRTLGLVAKFIARFPEWLDVVVGCARKTELEHWGLLFGVVGRPRDLYEQCISASQLRTAASYLLVMHTLEEADDAADTVRLLRLAIEAHETQLCKELLRFLHSIDDTGAALCRAIDEVPIPLTGGLTPSRSDQSPIALTLPS